MVKKKANAKSKSSKQKRSPVCTVSGCSCTGYTSSGTAGTCACGHLARYHK